MENAHAFKAYSLQLDAVASEKRVANRASYANIKLPKIITLYGQFSVHFLPILLHIFHMIQRT